MSAPRRLLALAGCAALLLIPPLAAAQEPPRTLPIDRSQHFREQLVPRTPVSGLVRAGVLTDELVSTVNPGHLTVRIPHGATGRLCVDIRSANGEYHGRIDRPLDGVVPADYRIELPTAAGDFFRARGANEMAVLAYIAESCLEAPQAILLASWSGSISEERFWVFVNASRNQTLISATDTISGQRREFPCQPAPVELDVVYDQVCAVTVPRTGEYMFRIERRPSRTTRLPNISLPVRW